MTKSNFQLTAFILLILFNTMLSHAQDLKGNDLYFHSNGGNTGTLKLSEAGSVNKVISAYDAIKIQGRFYNQSKYPTIVIAKFTDENNEETSYPVAFADKKETKNFVIYGPLFYDGREKMAIKLQLLVIKDENDFNTIKKTYDKFYPDAIEFIPVLGQATKFIDLGWKVAEAFAPKDKIESSNEITINRESTSPLRTKMRWQLLTNKDAFQSLNAQLNNGFNVNDAGDVPNINFENGRAIFFSAVKANRVNTFKEIADRINVFLKKYDKRITDKELSFENPYHGETIQAALSLKTFIEIYLSTIEVAKQTPGNQETSEKPFIELLSTLQIQQNSDQNAGNLNNRGLFSLTPTYEKQAASVIKNLFEFNSLDGRPFAKETGFATINSWYIWLNSRCGSTKDNICKDKSSFEFKSLKSNIISPRNLIAANTKYAENYFDTKFPDIKAADFSKLSMVSKLELTKGYSKVLLTIVNDVFRPSNENPWLDYEKKAIAELLVKKIPELPNLQMVNEKYDFPAYAKELDSKINQSSVVLVPDFNGEIIKNFKLKSNVEFIAESFNSSIVKLYANTAITDKHTGMKNIFIENIVTPVNELLLPKEAELLLTNSRINRFPPLENTKLTPSNYDEYFKKGLLLLSVVGNTPIINENTQATLVLNRMKALDDLFAGKEDVFATRYGGEPGSNRLSAFRKAGLSELLNSIKPETDFSMNLIAINYFQDKVRDDNLITKKPTKNEEVRVWKAQASNSLSISNWDNNNRNFTVQPTDNEVERIRLRLLAGCNTDDPAKYKDCNFKPSIIDGGDTAEQSIQKLYEIIGDPNKYTPQKRKDAFDTIKRFVDAPAEVDQIAEKDIGEYYKTNFPIDKLIWKNGMFRLSKESTNPITSEVTTLSLN